MTTPGEQVQVIVVGEPGPQVVQIGTDSTPTPVYVPAPGGGGGPTVLDQLLDVDAPADLPGLLARQDDGVVRPVPTGDLYSRWFTGEGAPPNFVPGSRAGDMYYDQASGRLYQL